MTRARSARKSRKQRQQRQPRQLEQNDLAPARPRRFDRRSLLPVLVVVAGLVAYWSSFSGALLFDDEKHIVSNPRIHHILPLAETMEGRRPIVDLSLAINYAIGKLNVWGYHAFNLAIHLLAGLTLFGIVRRTLLRIGGMGKRQLARVFARPTHGQTSLPMPPPTGYTLSAPWLALVVAIIWVVHPLQTQSVTYLIQRGESLMGLFYLLTLYCLIRGMDSSRARRWWYAAGVIACALGMGSKAVMLTAPLVVLLYDRTFITRSFVETLRQRWGLYLGLMATWGVLAWCGVVGGVLGSSSEAATVGFSYKGITPMEYGATQFEVIAHYLSLSLWPHPLCLDYDWPVARTVGDVAGPALLIVPLSAATIWGVVRKLWFGFVGIWFFLILAPTSSFIPIKDPLFEHRMYLPLAAVVVLVVIGGYAALVYLTARPSWGERGRRSVATAMVVTVVALSMYGTIRRNRDYDSVLGMWTDVVGKRPTNARAHLGLGAALFSRGEAAAARGESAEAEHAFAEAERAFTESVRLNPQYARAHYNLGNALAKRDKFDEAVGAYHKSLRLNPRNPKCHYNLGNTLKKQGKLDEAISEYHAALRIDPRHIKARINLGNSLKMQGRFEEAVNEYLEALRINPRYANAHYNLGDALRQQGKLDEAITEFRLALQYNPKHRAARASLNALIGE